MINIKIQVPRRFSLYLILGAIIFILVIIFLLPFLLLLGIMIGLITIIFAIYLGLKGGLTLFRTDKK